MLKNKMVLIVKTLEGVKATICYILYRKSTGKLNNIQRTLKLTDDN